MSLDYMGKLYSCAFCGKTYQYQHTLQRHAKNKHAESAENRYECYICGETTHRKNMLNEHLKRKHGVVMHDNAYPNAITPPPLQRASVDVNDVRAHEEIATPSYSKWNENPYNVFKGEHSSRKASPYQFKHPFCMMVAGPSRSGKTYWVAKLLMTKDKRIHPTPDRIVYCYRHWQKLYNTLRMSNPSIRWQQGLPNSVLVEKLEDTIVVIDDLMEAGMSDPTLMSMFTEGSHHRNISVIFIVQNLLHQGRRSRSLNLNTQYLVLYKNPRDMQQIKTIAQQMYPTDWRRFLAYFEAETSRPYGKVIIDLHPETEEKNRFVVDDDDTQQLNTAGNSGANNVVLQRMEARQEMINPYTSAIQNKQEEMQRLLQNPLMEEPEKAIKYNQMLNDFIVYKERAALELSPQVVLNSSVTPTPQQHEATWQPKMLTGKRILTPSIAVDPADIPLPLSSEDEQSSVKKKKWFSYSDDEEEEEEERKHYRHELRKRLRDDKEY